MKPGPFDYHDPVSVDEVVGLLAEHGDECKLLAGGQSLLPMLALRLAQFPHIVDINKVSEIASIEATNGSIRIGAMVRQTMVGSDSRVAEHVPLLARATKHIGHFQIRNRGTIGGSIAHADAAAEYPAVAVALGAVLHLRSSKDSRSVPASEFFQGMWTTASEADEVLTHVEFPSFDGIWSDGFAEIARRHGDYATAGAAAHLRWDDDRVVEGSVVLFAVDSAPRTFSATDLGLVGSTLADVDVDAAGRAVSAQVEPVSDIHGSMAYRKSMAGVVARRALHEALSERQV